MNNKDAKLHQLFDSLSSIDGDLLADVSPAKPSPPIQRKRWTRWQRYATVAAALLVVVAGGMIWHLFLKGSINMTREGAAPMDYESAAERGRDTQFGGTAGTQTNALGEGSQSYDSIDQLVHDSPFIFQGVLLWTEEIEDGDECGQMSFEILSDKSLDLSSVSDPSLLSWLVRDRFDDDYAHLIETSLASIEDP